MLADIAQGNTGFADIMFLVAFILFLVEFLVAFLGRERWPYPWAIAMAGLACLSLGWLVL